MPVTHKLVSTKPDSADPTKVSSSEWNDAHKGNGLDWFNVKDYGADPSGVADSTAAITAAIAAIPTAGGTLYFPAGTYKTSGGFNIAKNCTVRGEGSGGVYQALTSNVSLVTCTSPTAILFSVTGVIVQFENIALQNVAVTNPSAGAAITVTGSNAFQRVDYDNVIVSGFWIGIDVQSGSHWTMHACTIASTWKYCLRITNLPRPDEGDYSIDGCWFQQPESRTIDAAIRLEGAGGGKIANTRINGFSVGFTYGIDLFVPTNVMTGELFLSQVSIVGFATAGLNGSYGTYPSLWSKIMLTGCLIVTYNSTTTSRAVILTGAALGIGSQFLDVTIVGCVLGASAGAARAAVLLTNCGNAYVGSNVVDRTYFATVLETSGSVNSVVDASGAIGSGVTVSGIPAAGQVAVATTPTAGSWLTPSWLAWAAYGAAVTRTPGLLAYWRLGEPSGTSAADTGPHAITGTYVGAPTLGVTGALSGDGNTAATFNGWSQRVDIGVSAFLSCATAVSVEGWYKGTGDGILFARIEEGMGTGLDGYRLSVTGSGATFDVGDAASHYIQQAGGSIKDNAWHHVVGTRNGDAMAIYVDGVSVYYSATICSTVGSMAGSRFAMIAARPYYAGASPDVYLTGTADEVAVYSRALDPVEVLMHYRIGHGS